MTPRLTNIHISNLRGIRDLDIPLSRGENLLVIGDNGSGKSSIVDAIEFFFKQEIEKLSGRGDIITKDCVPFNGSDTLDCYVDILFNGTEKPLRTQFIRSSNGKSYAARGEVPLSLTPVLEFARSRPFILHRAQLTQFIESRPSPRFESISELIGLESVDKVIDVWKKERTARSSKKEETQKRSDSYSRQVADLLGESITSEENLLLVINARLNRLGYNSISNRTELSDRVATIRSGSVTPTHNQEILIKLHQFINAIRRIRSIHGDFLAAFEAQSLHIQRYQELARQQADADFINVIEESERLVSQKNLDFCPVCEQQIDRAYLLERLTERRKLLQGLFFERSSLEQAAKDCQTALSTLNTLWEEIINLSPAVQIELPQEFFASQSYFQYLNRLVNDANYPAEVYRRETTKFITLIKPFDHLAILAEKRIAELAPSEKEQELLSASYSFGKIDSSWVEWKRAKIEVDDAIAKYIFVDRILSELIETRRKVVQQIVSDLEQDFIHLYEKLHPGEGHRAIQIILVETRDSSADLRAEMDGMPPMHPLGHFSEGHLDSLGLCIFLAFIKRFNKDFRLIVLDDVLTSIDSGHRMKVAQLIAEDFRDYQILLTTHDEMWANQLAMLFRKEQIPLKTIRMNLWTKENGATYDEYMGSNWEYYKELVRKGHKQDAIGGVGRDLEQFLFSMRRNLHLAVPATADDRYTLGQILPIFLKWVSDHKMIRPDIEDVNKQLIVLREELDVYWNLRNWSGAHYNKWGATVSTEEALDFISIVEELIGFFQCPVCSCLVIYDTTASQLRCPICEPQPAPAAPCRYKPEWRISADRLLMNRTGLPTANKHLLSMVQSTFEKLLVDSRRYLKLMVPPTMDDQYTIKELFTPFFAQLLAFPIAAYADWEEVVMHSRDTLQTFLLEDSTWQESDALLPHVEEVYRAVATITDAISCSKCHHLLVLNCESRIYSCPKCSTGKELLTVSPAAWFIN